MRNPVIGITPSPSEDAMGHGSFYRFCLSETYVKAVQDAGGIPIILPSSGEHASDAIDLLDGLILSGGGDIAPARFTDEPPHEETDRIDDHRDSFELALMQEAARRDLPTLAICRGIQVMNVAFGGTIHQHVPDNVPSAIEHRQHNSGYSQHDVSHLVTFTSSPNPFSELLDADELMVNSYHHQAPADVPTPLIVDGRSADGVVEAIHHQDMTFGLGVQWHPEMLAPNFPSHARLFGALVQAARKPVTIA